ncbi:hypothetical protein K438DRAFT_1984040 [Mycena galopus ATCC 62051]|nr:hypothetical protein K438DRAFT_1984040 [Mycena galopus ATCC 62051]
MGPTIHINGNLLSLPRHSENDEPEDEDMDDENDTDDPEGEFPSDVEVAVDAEEPKITDGPDYMFEEGEISSRDPKYVFCPKQHRKGVLRLACKHFVCHLFFRNRNGKHSTGPEIWWQAVTDMYQFCKQRNLRERWVLWARSADPIRLSQLRTSMTVKNLWERIKHTGLHNLTHPHLDQLVYLLIYQITPAIDVLEYPCVKRWKCFCGHQKYNAFHLCKHLVQAVPDPSVNFWVEVNRRRTMPLYRNPELHPIDEPRGEFSALDDGCVTDGDDQVWTGDKSMLSGGRWHLLTKNAETILGKRVREDTNSSPEVSQEGLDEHKDDERREWLKERVLKFRQVAEMMEKQAEGGTSLWMSSISRRDIGRDVADMVDDIMRDRATHRPRETTWARAEDQIAARRQANTMGYVDF